MDMSNDTTFQLDTLAAEDILTKAAAPLILQSGQAIASRAQAMASSTSNNPPQITLKTSVGTIRRGRRAIATVTVEGGADAHANYIGRMALVKARDAGRV